MVLVSQFLWTYFCSVNYYNGTNAKHLAPLHGGDVLGTAALLVWKNPVNNNLIFHRHTKKILKMIKSMHNLCIFQSFDIISNHSFSRYAKFSENLTFLPSWYAYVQKVCLRTKWISAHDISTKYVLRQHLSP